MNLARQFIRRCKERPKTSKVADSMGQDWTGSDLLVRTLIMQRLLRRHVLAPNEANVGLLLPPACPAFAANLAMALDHRVSVNLNYSASVEVMNECIEMAGIKTVLSSKRFLEKLKLTGLNAKIFCLEDLKDKVTWQDKAVAGFLTYVAPAPVCDLWLGLSSIKSDDLATIIFTSGSTGTPKGVMVTHGNLAFNVDSINQIISLRPSDVMLGILPFFHVFGYTVTLWAVAAIDIKGAYHFSPLDAKLIGNLCEKHKGTILLSTPTFLRSYLKRIEKDAFATIDVVVTGAEKLPMDLADAFEQKFGVRPIEGFGATETTPLVSVNIPPSRNKGGLGAKAGTVGKPVPGNEVRIMSLDNAHPLPAGEAGMVEVKGPCIMKGYWNRPDLTEKVIKDGWYVTGDLGMMDADGFLVITGRESRFSKIGGEMVPHILVEETINRILGASDDELKAVVTSTPDEKKGERLIVLHTGFEHPIDDVRRKLSDEGLPNLFIPGADGFHQVEAIPVLGTGKLDLKKMKSMALEAVSKEKASETAVGD